MGSDVEVLDTVLLIAGALLLILVVFAEVIRRLWLSVPLIVLAAGVLLGPEVLGLVAPEELGDAKKIMEGLARMTLALAVIDIALRFDRSTLDSLWRSSLRLVFGGMLGMWLLVASVVAHSTTATPGVRRYARRSMIEPLRNPLDAARRTP